MIFDIFAKFIFSEDGRELIECINHKKNISYTLIVIGKLFPNNIKAILFGRAFYVLIRTGLGTVAVLVGSVVVAVILRNYLGVVIGTCY